MKRAIAKSDTLVKEIFERVEGRVPNDPAQGAQFGNTVVVVDIPRPPKTFDWEAAEREDDERDKDGG